MPTMEDIQKKADPAKLLEMMKSVAHSTVDSVKKNPELLTVPAGALAGAFIGNKVSDNGAMGTAAGGAGGAGLAYALTKILNSPAPAVPAVPYRDQPDRSIITSMVDHPVLTATAGAVATPPALYTVRKAIDHFSNGTQSASTAPGALKDFLLKVVTGNPAVWDKWMKAARIIRP